ncbi:MAG: hypothetical protein MJB14_08825 [Spirochaetes bacterium]|nr:hypothetical protein [Spirochaetota bacterium]
MPVRKKSTSSTRRYFHSISLNLLRLAFLMIICGLFLPVGCSATGAEITQGILGKAQFGDKLMFLAIIDDIYAYLFMGVFLVAIAGLTITFIKRNFLICWAFALMSLALLLIVLFKFNIAFDIQQMAFYMNIGMFRKKLALQYGAFLMFAGYFVAIVTLILRNLRVIN